MQPRPAFEFGDFAIEPSANGFPALAACPPLGDHRQFARDISRRIGHEYFQPPVIPKRDEPAAQAMDLNGYSHFAPEAILSRNL